MATVEQMREWFEKHDDEHCRFSRIPEADRLHPLWDICAVLYLHGKMGSESCMAMRRSVDIGRVWLAWSDWDLFTEDDVIYLMRCGVHLNVLFNRLVMVLI